MLSVRSLTQNVYCIEIPYTLLVLTLYSAVSDGLGINLTVLTGYWSATMCSWSSYMGHCKNNAHL